MLAIGIRRLILLGSLFTTGYLQLFHCNINPANAQGSMDQARVTTGLTKIAIIDAKVIQVKIDNATVPQCFALVCSRLGIRCAIEDVPCAGASAADEAVRVSVDMANMSARAVLSGIVSKTPTFQWTLDADGTARLLPKAALSDKTYVLTHRISGYNAPGVDLDVALFRLVSALRATNPTLTANLTPRTPPTNAYSENLIINIDRSGTDPRSIMDLVARKLGWSWEISLDPSGRCDFSFIVADGIPLPPSITSTSIVIPEVVKTYEGYNVGLPPAPSLDIKVDAMPATKDTLPHVVAVLAQKYHFQYGIEMVPSIDVSPDDLARVDEYVVSAGSLGDAFNSLIASNPTYMWQISNGYIRFYPRRSGTSPAYLMNSVISDYSAGISPLIAAVDRLIEDYGKTPGAEKLLNGVVESPKDIDGDTILYNTSRNGATVLNIVETLAGKAGMSWSIAPVGPGGSLKILIAHNPLLNALVLSTGKRSA